MKNADNWITDIEHISESLSKETEDAENGLDYQAYLSILQAMNIDGATARIRCRRRRNFGYCMLQLDWKQTLKVPLVDSGFNITKA